MNSANNTGAIATAIGILVDLRSALGALGAFGVFGALGDGAIWALLLRVDTMRPFTTQK